MAGGTVRSQSASLSVMASGTGAPAAASVSGAENSSGHWFSPPTPW